MHSPLALCPRHPAEVSRASPPHDPVLLPQLHRALPVHAEAAHATHPARPNLQPGPRGWRQYIAFTTPRNEQILQQRAQLHA